MDKKQLRQAGISFAAFLIKLLTWGIIWAIILAATIGLSVLIASILMRGNV